MECHRNLTGISPHPKELSLSTGRFSPQPDPQPPDPAAVRRVDHRSLFLPVLSLPPPRRAPGPSSGLHCAARSGGLAREAPLWEANAGPPQAPALQPRPAAPRPRDEDFGARQLVCSGDLTAGLASSLH